jgi:formylglycine-generating enzyme required for sulfatase activity
LRAVLAPPGGSAFALGTVEITQRQYHAFLTDPSVWPRVQKAWTASVRDPATDLVLLPRRSPSPDGATWQIFAAGDDHATLERVTLPDALADMPVTGISRDDAEAYCAWLAKRSGVAVRLPTRAEWQWAATGGDQQRVFPWGALFDPAFTVSALGFPPDQADVQKPGSRPDDRGPFGHQDLGGNVREWLSDRPSPDDRTAWFGALMAGGGWHDAQPDQFRSAFVESAAPNLPNGEIGFRILVPLP